ncbi:hypothetical protein AMECASPLE_025984 [Ameca splendens]|uniref:Uncharacterized protein n=1 Tax=Ameca splendens TaxID=208324 RepID=A0ABV0XTU1_9TELE
MRDNRTRGTLDQFVLHQATPEADGKILDRISWPTMTDDDKDDDDCIVEDKSRVTGYLRQFIQNASTDELKTLIKFWVGWEAPTRTRIWACLTNYLNM